MIFWSFSAPKAGALAKLSYTPLLAWLLPHSDHSVRLSCKHATHTAGAFYTTSTTIATVTQISLPGGTRLRFTLGNESGCLARRSSVVVGVDLDVAGAQIAAVAEIARFAGAQIYGDRMLGLRDDLGGLGRIEFLGRSVLENRHRTETA